MVENFKKLKKIIEKAQDVTLLPSPDFRKDSFPAALALFFSLKKLGKNVNLIAENYPQKYNSLIKQTDFHLPQGNFLISIKASQTKLSQLFYEKTENGLNLYLKTNGGELKKENFALHSLGVGELLITLGIGETKKVKELSREGAKERTASVINIDNQLENENYGQLNLIEVGSASLSEIIFDFLISIDKKLFTKETVNSLLLGIVEATRNFQTPELTSQTFQKVGFLINKGANLKEISSQLYRIENESSFQIFGRIFNKLNFLENLNLGWVLLTEEDFLQANASSSDLKFALEKLTSGIFPFQNFLCLWESKNSPSVTRGVFYSPNKKMRQRILENFKGLEKGEGALFQSVEMDIEKVKDKIFEILSL